MTLHNISYNDPKVRRSVEKECGPAFSVWNTLLRGGTGSPRFHLCDAPPALLEVVDRPEDRRFCSFEVRPNGLLIRLRNRLETLGILLAWSHLENITLGSPDQERMAPLRLVDKEGHRLLFAVHREYWGTVDRLLARAVPHGLYRTSTASTL